MSISSIPPVAAPGCETAGTLAMAPISAPAPTPFASGETTGSLASSSPSTGGSSGGGFSAVA